MQKNQSIYSLQRDDKRMLSKKVSLSLPQHASSVLKAAVRLAGDAASDASQVKRASSRIVIGSPRLLKQKQLIQFSKLNKRELEACLS